MKHRIKLTYADGDYPYPGEYRGIAPDGYTEIFFCAEGLRDFFDFELGTETVYLVLSSRPSKFSYRVAATMKKHSYGRIFTTTITGDEVSRPKLDFEDEQYIYDYGPFYVYLEC